MKKNDNNEYVQNDEPVLPDKLQIEFQWRSDKKLYPDSLKHTWYRFDIPLANIERFEIKEDLLIDTTVESTAIILIYLYKPVTVLMEFTKEKDKHPIVSFLDLTLNSNKTYFQLLNQWNGRQVIKLKGKLNEAVIDDDFLN